MSTSSVNNGSQANSDIAAAVPHVHFAEEAVAMAGPSINPDSHRRDQRAMRRFQRATSIEVEFSSELTISVLLSSLIHVF